LTTSNRPSLSPAEPPDDPLVCLACDYNLTGITSARCPECGRALDWDALRAERERDRGRRGTPWERWPWYLKPAGLLVTAFQVALLPWVFASQLPAHPRLRWPLTFALLCLASIMAYAVYPRDLFFLTAYLVGATVCTLALAVLLWLLLTPRRVPRPFRFWLAVACYTCYPLPAQIATEGFVFIVFDLSPVWPFSFRGSWISANFFSTVLFWLWWADILVIAAVRSKRGQAWRLVLLAVGVVALAIGASYAGAYSGSALFPPSK